MISKTLVPKSCAHQSSTFDRFGTCSHWSASRNLPFSRSSNQKRWQIFPSDSRKISHSKLAIALCGPSFGEAFDWNEASFEIVDPNEPQISGFDAEFAARCCCIEGLRFWSWSEDHSYNVTDRQHHTLYFFHEVTSLHRKVHQIQLRSGWRSFVSLVSFAKMIDWISLTPGGLPLSETVPDCELWACSAHCVCTL